MIAVEGSILVLLSAESKKSEIQTKVRQPWLEGKSPTEPFVVHVRPIRYREKMPLSRGRYGRQKASRGSAALASGPGLYSLTH
jgi:hypothetical protein